MGTTILKHNEMAVDTKAPHCRKCDRPVSISRVDTKVSETGIRSSMTYEHSLWRDRGHDHTDGMKR
jgi:hypothetical protein